MKNFSPAICIFILIAIIPPTFAMAKDKLSRTIHLKTPLNADYMQILQQATMIPQKNSKGVIECFSLMSVQSNSQFEKTELKAGDCLVKIKSYQIDPKTVEPKKTPVVIPLNSVSNMAQLFIALKAAYKVELDFQHNHKKYHWVYLIEYIM